jgi:hypothetical protein
VSLPESLILPTAKIITVTLVFSSASSVKAEKEKTPGLVYNLNSDNIDVIASKRRYLLQKFHTVPYQFDGLGFFFVNHETLVDVKAKLEEFRIANRILIGFRLPKLLLSTWFTFSSLWVTQTSSPMHLSLLPRTVRFWYQATKMTSQEQELVNESTSSKLILLYFKAFGLYPSNASSTFYLLYEVVLMLGVVAVFIFAFLRDDPLKFASADISIFVIYLESNEVYRK